MSQPDYNQPHQAPMTATVPAGPIYPYSKRRAWIVRLLGNTHWPRDNSEPHPHPMAEMHSTVMTHGSGLAPSLCGARGKRFQHLVALDFEEVTCRRCRAQWLEKQEAP